jgi:hypothetical protein
MIRRSFSEFHAQRDNKEKKRRLEKGSLALATLKEIECIFGEPDIDNYKAVDEQLVRINWDINDFILQVLQNAGPSYFCTSVFACVNIWRKKRRLVCMGSLARGCVLCVLCVSCAGIHFP